MAKKAASTKTSDIPQFATAGKVATSIEVKISYRIIQLFSEGLYSSPNKAIEELVSNSFDAGAENVHVMLSSDLTADDASIAVIDDGAGMDKSGLASHWIIGESTKRKKGATLPKGRKQIGKFGIGKLATYVLANRLSHISKVNDKFYATSMDYTMIPSESTAGAGTLGEVVPLPLRLLSSEEAQAALLPWITGDEPAFSALTLFGASAKPSWTVAIMSELKDMVKEIKPNRLKWILSTAMPLRSDFNLYLNGDKVESSKLRGAKIARWQLGRTLKRVTKPDEITVVEDLKQPKESQHRFGLSHPVLGTITGSVDLYEDLLTQGKAVELGRSHGFFIYSRGRLINSDDPYFGIGGNKLRHGTFSRMRAEIHIDRLDAELRSSRESVRETGFANLVRTFLESIFALVRKKHEEHEEADASGRRATTRVADAAHHLARTPLKRLLLKALNESAKPYYIKVPKGQTETQKQELTDSIEDRSSSPSGLISKIVQSPLGQDFGLVRYDIESGILEINSLHPFVAYFGDEFSDKQQGLPLELVATSEVMLEASMYDLNLKESQIQEVLTRRDALLRDLAKSVGKRNALVVSQDLLSASSDQDLLEQQVVSALDIIGFDTVPVGGTGMRDAIAQSHVGGGRHGAGPYNVSVDVFAKTGPGRRVSAATIGVARIVRRRDEGVPQCDHALVVLVDFPEGSNDRRELKAQLDRQRMESQRTVTFITVNDFARLTRLAPARRLGLSQIRMLLSECVYPDEATKWIDRVADTKPSDAPYREILEAIYEEQKALPGEMVEYRQVEARLRLTKQIVIQKLEIIALCQALFRIVPEFVYASDTSVELNTRPDRIMDALNAAIKLYPENLAKKGRRSNENQ